MTRHTKTLILEYLSHLSDNFDFQHIDYFTAQSISNNIHISRSLASQYLNVLVKEKLIMKVNTRPVYFLHRKKMERLYRMKFQEDDFYDLDEIKDYIQKHSTGNSDYSKIIGYERSLAGTIKQLKEVFEYPPTGLPVVVHGEKGVGKRTLCLSIFENALRKGVIDGETELIKLEFSRAHQDQSFVSILQNVQKEDRQSSFVFLFCDVEYMSAEFQDQLCQFIEDEKQAQKDHYHTKRIRYFFICNQYPQLVLSERLLKNIPVSQHVPSLKNRSHEEREEFIIYFIQEESKKTRKILKVSNVVLRALINGDYSQNLIELQSIIRVMCASALQDHVDHDEVVIHTHHLPESILSTMPIVINEDIIYIDTATYVKSEQIDFVIDYIQQIFKPFTKSQDFFEALIESKHHFDLLNDYLSYKQRIPPERIKGIELSLFHIIDVVLKKRYMNLPSGFCCALAKLIYIHELYSASIEQWQQQHHQEIEEISIQLKEHLLNESMVAEELSRLIAINLERPSTPLLLTMMIVYLHYYNLHLTKRKIFGMIVCHGYSTATSIADATNCLLENYIFDAVDMPLTITIDEVKDILVERLDRMNKHIDVIVMVDMGSLEKLGQSLSMAINCNVGVINSVSTRLALNVGHAILNDESLSHILQKVSQNSLAQYTIVDRKKKDTIVFVSEGGIHLAQRMRKLFEESFPTQIAVNLEVCNYTQLLTRGQSHEIFAYNNILFMTGTDNPHIEGQVFIALENIISGNDIDVIMQRLSFHLKPEELKQLIDNLRKNFTLQNVVGYLTILNPKVLLDNVSFAVDILQDYLQRQFSGKTLTGIYIHVCCLVERLVTKTAISEYDKLENFEEKNQMFIQHVHDAFQSLSKRYNITIPTSEIAYLYAFVNADMKKEISQEGEEKYDEKG